MKHLKYFETIKEAPKYEVGDIVIFKPSHNMISDFSNYLAKIKRVDDFSNSSLPEKQKNIYYSLIPLGYIDKSSSKNVKSTIELQYTEKDILRKATPDEIEMIEIQKNIDKYNL